MIVYTNVRKFYAWIGFITLIVSIFYFIHWVIKTFISYYSLVV